MKIKHGGELREFSHKFGLPEKEILDFSSNINPLGPPASLKKIYEEGFEELSRYPDPEALEFRREVARHFPLWTENVIAGNGAIELLDLVLRFLHPRRALLIEPAFLEYRRMLNLLGAEVRSVRLKDPDNFSFSLPGLVNALRGVELLILAHPNNPTGSFLPKEKVQELLSEAKRRNVFVVLDEAFVDWMPELSLAKEIRDDSFYFVIRSLTKFFALPGIRIGYGLGARKLIERLLHYGTPWSCNRLAQKLGVAALRDRPFIEESLKWLPRERGILKTGLESLAGFRVYPSAANFLLIHSGTAPVPSLCEEMGRKGIYLRDLTEFPGLGPGYFRVAVRKREENLKLVQAMRMVLQSTSLRGSVPRHSESQLPVGRQAVGAKNRASSTLRAAWRLVNVSQTRDPSPLSPAPPVPRTQDDGGAASQ